MKTVNMFRTAALTASLLSIWWMLKLTLERDFREVHSHDSEGWNVRMLCFSA